MNILFSWVLPGVFCLTGFGIFILGVKRTIKEKEAKKWWKQTEGIVKNIEVSEGSSLMGSGSTMSGMRTSHSPHFKYYPVYEYFADSISYTIKGGNGSSNPQAVRKGDRAGILYNPENPAHAMLENSRLGRIFILAGIIFIIAGIVFFL